jgi:hypothetical protein
LVFQDLFYQIGKYCLVFQDLFLSGTSSILLTLQGLLLADRSILWSNCNLSSYFLCC